MAYYSPNYNPYTTPYGTIAGIRSLKESISGLTQDYLQRKRQEAEMQQALAQQEQQARQAEAEHSLALTRAQAEQAGGFRDYQLALRRQEVAEQAGKATREGAMARGELTATQLEKEKLELEKARYENEIISFDDEFDIKTIPAQHRPVVQAMAKLLPDKAPRWVYEEPLEKIGAYLKTTPGVIKQTETEKLLGTFRNELKVYNPVGNEPGFMPNSRPIADIAKRVREATGGEYEVVPYEIEAVQVPVPSRIIKGVEPTEITEPEERITELTPEKMQRFRQGMLEPKPGVKYGYLIQRTQAGIAPRSPIEKKPVSGEPVWQIYPYRTGTEIQQYGIPDTRGITTDLLTRTPSPSTLTPDQAFDMLENAGVVPPTKEVFRDIVEGRTNISDYINTHKKR